MQLRDARQKHRSQSAVRVASGRRRRRLGSRGQVMAVTAIMAPVLLGFTGIAIDVSNSSAQRRILQSAADHGALAAATQITKNQTETAATAAASQIASLDGFAGAITITYLDSSRAATATPANVAYVGSTVTRTVQNYFGALLGTSSRSFTITAEAHIITTPTTTSTAICAICVLNPTAVKAYDNQDAGGTTTISNGGIVVVSTAAGGLNNVSTINLNGANNYVKLGGPSYTGNSVGGAIIQYNQTLSQPDPFAYLSPPSTGPLGPGANVTAGSTLAPGTYHNVTINGSTTFTAGGLYVFTGALTLTSSGSTLDSNHSLLYFTCITYPVPCLPGLSGGTLTNNGGSATLTRTTGGSWKGMSVFFDRNNRATLLENSNNGSTYDGGIYLKSGYLRIATQSQVNSWNVRLTADRVYWNTSGNGISFDAIGVVGGALTIVLSQ